MIGGINYASSQIASVYNKGAQELSNTLTRIASGKKFQSAAEDLIGYLRASSLSADIKGYEAVQQNLTELKSYTSAAVEAGTSIYESLNEMKELHKQYAGAADDDLKAEYAAEFSALKKQINTTLASSYVDGANVLTAGVSVKEVNLDPDANSTLDVEFTGVSTTLTIDALSISAADDLLIEAEQTTMLTYMSEAKSYDAMANQQLSFTDTIINSKQAVKSLITDIDEAEETNNAIDQSIRQQAAMSMLSQANMSRQAVLKLYS
jgi:flagellin